MMRKYLFTSIVVFLFASGFVWGQGLSTGYFIDGFLYRHTLNPAYGNEQSYVSVPGVGNANVNMSGNFGLEDAILDNPLYPEKNDRKKTTFLNPYLPDALSGFNKSINKVTADAHLTLASVGFKLLGGYSTIELNARSEVDGRVPFGLLEMAAKTGNENYNIGDVSARAQGFAEFAMGYSRLVTEKLRLGGKVKLLLGVANAEVEMNDLKADLQQSDQWLLHGDAQSHVSMKGFQYISHQKEYKYSDGKYQYVDDIDVDGFGINGTGVAIDLGAVYHVMDNLELSLALQDLGFIAWKNDLYATNVDKSFIFNGFYDVEVKGEGRTPEHIADQYFDQLCDFYHLQDQGDQGGRTTSLGMKVRMGGKYCLPAYSKLSFGLLNTISLNGRYSWAEGRMSANLSPTKWFDGGFSLALSSFAASVGFILNFHPKGFNFFVGSDCLIRRCSKEFIPLNSNGGFAIGINIAW